MAITVHAVGTPDAGTTALDPVFPTWTYRSGDIALILIVNKYPTNAPTTPEFAPTIANARGEGGAGAAGVDTGTVYSSAYRRNTRGSETGATHGTIAVASGNTGLAVIIIIRPDVEGGVLDIACANGADNSGGAASWSVTMGTDPGLAAGDLVVVLNAINTDNYTYSSQAISAAGCTFGTVTEQIDTGSAGGQDIGIYVASAPVSTGPSSGNAVYTMTANGSATSNPAGSAVLIRIREIANTVQWLGRAQAAVAGTTSLSIVNHTGIAAGDLLLVATASKYVAPTTPSGDGYALDANGQHVGGVGTTGLDTGLVYASVYTKTADGTENSGNLSVSIPSGNSAIGNLFAFRPPSGYTWALTYSKGTDNSGGTAYSATGDADLVLAAGDIVVTTTAINTDFHILIDYALTNTGVTFAPIGRLGSLGTTNGDDSAVAVNAFYVLSGTSGGNVPTLAGTLTGAGANAAGPTIFTRLRAVAGEDMTAAATIAITATAVLNALGNLVAAASAAISATADLDATGSLASAATLAITATADLTAPAPAVDVEATATIALTVTADLDAAGTLASAATFALTTSADLDAAGNLASAALLSLAATADLDAIGQLAAAATLAITTVADLTESAPKDLIVAASIALTASADLDAVGTLTAAATLALTTAADLDATGSLVAAATLSVTAAADLDAIANIAAAVSIAITVTADLTSPAANDMSVAAVLSLTTSADLDAIGNMAAAAALALTVSANLGDPRMAAAATLAISATAVISAPGNLVAATSLALTTSAALQGGAALAAAASVAITATASLKGAGELDAIATIDITASVVLDAVGNLVSVALIQFTVSATVVDANADQLPPINNPGAISGGAYLGARTGTLVLDTVSASASRGGRTTTIVKGAASSSVRREVLKTL